MTLALYFSVSHCVIWVRYSHLHFVFVSTMVLLIVVICNNDPQWKNHILAIRIDGRDHDWAKWRVCIQSFVKEVQKHIQVKQQETPYC